MYKLKYISILIASLTTASCVHTMNTTDINEPTHSIIRTNNSSELEHYSENKLREIPNPNKRNYFLGEHQEIQCLGDMYSAYNTWNVGEMGMHDKHQRTRTITILPVTNQTNYQDTDIPKELTMQTQKIAAQLGIGHNIIFVPSKIDKYENSFYSKYDNFLDQIKEPDNLYGLKHQLGNSIFIVASLIEYDDPNRLFSNGVTASTDGTTNKKSFGLGFGVDKDRFTGRMGMTFSVVYPASNVGMFNSPQFVYHPDASVSVYLDFKETSNANEFSVSYDGGRPTLGYRDKFQKRDSKFIATSLLIERGLLKVLGRYYKMPYWRCMSQNLIANQNKQVPLDLDSHRKVYGYDEHVEKNVRRTFRYITDAATGMSPYTKRPQGVATNDRVAIILRPLDKGKEDGSTKTTMKPDNEDVATIKIISKTEFDNIVNKTKECTKKINEKTTNYKEYNKCIDSILIDDKIMSEYIKNISYQGMIYKQLAEVAEFNIDYLPTVNERQSYKNYFQVTINRYEKQQSEDQFVDLWLSLPYQIDSRIYPNYLNFTNWKENKGTRK